MSPSSFREARDGGFTLIEVTITMGLLVIVLVLSGSLLFSMKSFAQKQQSFAEPRQTARRAIEYLSYYARGASDQVFTSKATPAPNAIVTHYDLNGTNTQACFDNVDPTANGDIADPGTDVVTLAKPNAGSSNITILDMPSSASSEYYFGYTMGCPDNDTNMSLFKQAVGFDPATGNSSLLILFDSFTGRWQYYQITNFQQSVCASGYVKAVANPGGSDGTNPPGGQRVMDCTANGGIPHCKLTAGVQFITFRVRTANGTPRLEQFAAPYRLFNPAVDRPGTAFIPLLDNVEDLQVSYIFRDGSIWNSAETTNRYLDGTGTPDHVPSQVDLSATLPGAHDAVNVRGLRVSVVARSARPLPAYVGLGGTGHAPPTVPPENSTAAYTPGYYHYRLTATVMLQNRVLGN